MLRPHIQGRHDGTVTRKIHGRRQRKILGAFGPTNNWPVCSLILRKISGIGATRAAFSCPGACSEMHVSPARRQQAPAQLNAAQVSEFKAKMHQICFQLALCPTGKACSTPPDSLAVRGLLLTGGSRKGRQRKGKWEQRGQEMQEGIWPTQNYGMAPLWENMKILGL